MAIQNTFRNLVLAIAVIVTIGLFFISFFFGMMGVVIIVILVMSFRIMGETEHLPDVVAKLQDDAKGIVLENRGNDQAFGIHVALVPMNEEFDVPDLKPDERHTLAFPTMIEEVKAVVTFKNSEGRTFSRRYVLSPLRETEEDILKPMIPLFGWK